MKNTELNTLTKKIKKHILLVVFAGVSLLILWFIVAIMVVIWIFNLFIAPHLGQEQSYPSTQQNPIQRGQQWLNQQKKKEQNQIDQLQQQVNELQRTVDELKQDEATVPTTESSASPL